MCTSTSRLSSLAQRMPHLQSLSTRVAVRKQLMTFPQQLRVLRLWLMGNPAQTSWNAALETLSQLAELTELAFAYPSINGASFAPLISMQQLRKLNLLIPPGLTAAQLQQVRSMSQLQVLHISDEVPLGMLLAPGHRLRLQDVGEMGLFSCRQLRCPGFAPEADTIERG